MKTKREHIIKKDGVKKGGEDGNALIYVLIAIVLFAALSFTVARQNNHAETSNLDDAKAELYAEQLIAYASQAKNTIDQMTFTGTKINDLDFTLPSDSGFNTAPNINKVYHPAGGGLSPGNIPEKAQQQITSDPVSSWYMGRFNNIEWTKTAAQDVVLTAYQVDKAVCKKINLKVTGSQAIPVLNGDLREYLVDGRFHSLGNSDLPTFRCPDCEGYLSLCVSNVPVTTFAFYNVLAAQ